MRKKMPTAKRKQSNSWIFENRKNRQPRPFSRDVYDSSKAEGRVPEKTDMDWLLQGAAFWMQNREQEKDPPNVYGLFESER